MELNPNCKCAVIIKNQDTPGMVGQIGTVLGEYGCNIANMALAREDGTGKALSVFELDSIPETSAVEEIKSIVETVKIVDFS